MKKARPDQTLKPARPIAALMFSLVVLTFSLQGRPVVAEPVVMKTGQESLTRTRQFELRDGVVYYGPASVERSELKPLESFAGQFMTPPKFKTIHADSSIVVTEAVDGRLFMLEFPTPGTLADKVVQQWSDQWGMPFASTLKLPRGAKAWSFSNRNIDVGHYEDAQGQAFFWGFAGCSTLYALSGDGRRLHYTDPWVPADFSREVCLPEQGTFIAENFSSSASTLFVIGRNGEMFTRLEDYDSNGGTPFFEFSYDTVTPHGLSGSDPKSEYQVRRPFLADWQAQPPIHLQGKARISRDITVLQNGQGNAARELRVAGIDAQGVAGYYYKAVHDGLEGKNPAVWKFKPADIKIEAADLIQVDLSEQAKRSNRGPDETFSLAGVKLKTSDGLCSDLSVQDLRFNWACGPALITFKNKAGQTFTARLHLADGWVPFAQPERYAAGDKRQVPFVRNYKGTLELPAELLGDRDLAPLNFKSFALAVTVGPGWAKVWGENKLEMQFGSEPKLPLFTSRLEQESVWTAGLQPSEALKQAIETNMALYDAMALQRADLHERKNVAFKIHAGLAAFETVGLVTWMGPTLMKQPFWNVLEHGRALVRVGDEWTYGMEEYTRGDYAMARSILKDRICADVNRLRQSHVSIQLEKFWGFCAP